jgi:hypothetical protein
MLAMMGSEIDTRMRAHYAVLAGVPALLLVLVLAIAPGALAASTVSSNWGGYVALPAGARSRAFAASRLLAGAARPSAGQDTYRRRVGLGGYRKSSNALSRSAPTPTARARDAPTTPPGSS